MSKEDTQKDEFPKDGVYLKWIRDVFVPSCGGRRILKNMTTGQVCKRFTKKRTRKQQVTYCELLRQEERPNAVAKATLFVSHTFQYIFLDALDALLDHLQDELDTAVVWWDLFSLQQHRPDNWTFEFFKETFQSAIVDFRRVVMIMSPWNDPLTFKRGWCVFEAYCAIAAGEDMVSFEIALNDAEKSRFLKDMNNMGTRALNKMLAKVSAGKSQCTVDDDKTNIFQVIQEDVGFSSLDSMLFKRYRQWVIATTQKALDTIRDDEMARCSLMTTLAMLHCAQGQYDEAEYLYTDCLEKRKMELGLDHPKTLASMHYLADLHRYKGNYQVAKPLYVDCLKKRQHKLGPEHRYTLASMNSLGYLCYLEEEYDTAKELFSECLQRRKETLGPDHPDTLSSMDNLAVLHESQGNYEAAESLCRKSLEKRKKELGPEHPDTLTSMNNLGLLHSMKGDYEGAKALHAQCWEKRKQKLGLEHPDTMTSMNHLDSSYRSLAMRDSEEFFHEEEAEHL